MESKIALRCAAYEAAGPIGFAVDRQGAVDVETLHDLASLWEVRTTALEELKSRVWQHFDDCVECPFCGDEEARTLDHYLPRSSYPEFSVVPINLIPACSTCNNGKGALPPRPGRRVLCPVVDPMDEPLLACSIQVVSSLLVPVFRIDPHSNVSFEVLAAAQFHFEQLSLAARFQAKASRAVESFLREVMLEGLSPHGASLLARRRGEAERETYGENRWSAVLYEALANHLAK